MQVYFPNIYDIKYLMKFCGNLHGGLNKLAETLDVKRLGPQHQVMPAMLCSFLLHMGYTDSNLTSIVLSVQAGSDSLLTSAAFLKLANSFFGGLKGVAKYKDVLYGYGNASFQRTTH